MTEFVFKPKRRKNGKSVESRLYSGRYRLSGQTKTITVALGISDKQAAEAQLRKLIRDLEREAAGIIAPKRMRDAANKSLRDHLLDYFADLKARKRAADYIAKTEMRLRKLATECAPGASRGGPADAARDDAAQRAAVDSGRLHGQRNASDGGSGGEIADVSASAERRTSLRTQSRLFRSSSDINWRSGAIRRKFRRPRN